MVTVKYALGALLNYLSQKSASIPSPIELVGPTLPLIKRALSHVTEPSAVSYGIRIVAETVSRSAELNFIAGQELGFNEFAEKLYNKSINGPYLTNDMV